ncbi:Rad9 family [Cryptosporidium sp. chipmunk genotype I]|uniref:Rad9 family n=1 Tax=Cryptosporidium sp. chipmunk genotype I TaxID=1280935 RepID=UPI00351A3403|nr:Rad9 family [Cryptosporidium sp. chipmunk genotype I]
MISVEGDNSLIKQLNNCLSCLLRGFKCQDVLIRVTDEYLMLYSFPFGGFSSCFQFNFDGRLFDKFETGDIVEFERLYKVDSLIKCFNNTQWFKATRFIFEINGDDDDTLKVTLYGKSGVVRKHRVYPVIGHQDRILLHETICWKRRHGIRVSSGLLKDIFGYMEIKESKMTLSISSRESLISIKVQPIGISGYDIPITGSSIGAGGTSGGSISNNSTYQDIQIKKEQIDTLSLCESILENNNFTFNSREFKIAIALAENCQLPVFLTLRAPGSPLIISIGQRAIIDQMCVSDLENNIIPFEYHWEKPLFHSKLFEIDHEFIEKTQIITGFSAVFLLSTAINPDSAPDPITSFNSPIEDLDSEPGQDRDQDYHAPMVISQTSEPGNYIPISSKTASDIQGDSPTTSSKAIRGAPSDEYCVKKEAVVLDCSFSKLDQFGLDNIFQRFGIENQYSSNDPEKSSSYPRIEIPTKDQGVKSFDWISTLMW